MINKNHGGYTIIELIISTSIIVIMLAIVIGSYSFGKKPEVLVSESEKFAGVLRNTRARAFNRAAHISAKWYCSLNVNRDCTTDSGVCALNNEGHCTNPYPPNGYGVHIEEVGGKSVYTIFADLDNSDGLPYFDDIPAGSDPEFVESFSLPDYLRLFLGTNRATKGEIIFNVSDVSIYDDDGGGWKAASDALDTYLITVEEANNDCGSIGKQGRVEIATTTLQIYESSADC